MHFMIAIVLILLTSALHALANPIRLAVTVDDLPSHGSLSEGETRVEVVDTIVEVLRRHHVPEVYGFVNYMFVDRKPELEQVLKAWLEAGFLLGNHTYSHKSIREVSPQAYINDIRMNETPLAELMAEKNWRLFRFPYLEEGETFEKRAAVRRYLKENGYTIAPVTVDFSDWEWNVAYERCRQKGDDQSVQWLKDTFIKSGVEILRRADYLAHLTYKRSVDHILLVHLGSFDAVQLDELLTAYEKEAVEYIPLTVALKDPIYREDLGWFSRVNHTIFPLIKYFINRFQDFEGRINQQALKEKILQKCS